MCGPPRPRDPAPIPERQPLQLPDDGATSLRTDEIARRRRGMMSTILTSSSGLGAPPATPATTLGGGSGLTYK